MLRINIRVIPHTNQRYETCGDWYHDADGTTQIAVSSLGNWKMEICVAIHELVECMLCRWAGIPQSEVDQFDMTYEALRKDGDESEPGDDPLAPYHMQHCIATGIERILVAVFGINWKDYEAKINAL